MSQGGGKRTVSVLSSFFLALLIIIFTGAHWDLPCVEGDPHKETWRKSWWDSNAERGPGWSPAAF